MEKPKAYMVCDYRDGNYNQAANNIGVEFMGNCSGRILAEDGTELGSHFSSSYGWLRTDLLSKINLNDWNVIDLIEQECPDRFNIVKPIEKELTAEDVAKKHNLWLPNISHLELTNAMDEYAEQKLSALQSKYDALKENADAMDKGLYEIEKLYKGDYEMPASKALKKAQMIAFQSSFAYRSEKGGGNG